MDLEALDKSYLLHTYARNYTNFVRGKGATLYDDKGRDYIDFASGIGVNALGHAHPKLVEAICDQTSKIIHISNLQVIEPQARLAERIVTLSGYDMACFFANSGAEANEGAIKIARKYGETHFEKKRYKVITLEHSFHGRTITTVKATGQGKFHQPHFSPYPDGFSYVPTIADIYDAIDDETVAVMIELVQGEGGVEPFDKAEVQALAKELRSRGLLLIVDEVQTGVYRTGAFLASNLYEIEPDIVTLAKGLGGGVPIGAVMTRLKSVLQPGDHGSTFGGNYLSTRAGLVVTEVLRSEAQSGALEERIAYFDTRLQALLKHHGDIFDKSVGIGLMRGLRCFDSKVQANIVSRAMEAGVVVLKAGRNTVRFLPPLLISHDEIDTGFERLETVLASL